VKNREENAGQVLLLGADGMLGRAWRRLLDREGLPYVAPSEQQCDLSSVKSIISAFDQPFHTVVNCAAYTNVDGCESDEAFAGAVNGSGVGVLAEQCARRNIKLLHYSTDYVFDGRSETPYAVNTPRRPINAYGRSKALGEELIEQTGGEYLILRTSWLYAPWGANFVRTIARLASERDSLRVVDDQCGRPTSAESLAENSFKLLELDAAGTFHLTDGGECTWFEFAREIVTLTGAACCVEPCTTEEFPRPARRPAYSVLDLSATEALLGPLPDWQSNLAAAIHHLEPLSV
jgi:dTDP-4-dehydrorhamnose reductase